MMGDKWSPQGAEQSYTIVGVEENEESTRRSRRWVIDFDV